MLHYYIITKTQISKKLGKIINNVIVSPVTVKDFFNVNNTTSTVRYVETEAYKTSMQKGNPNSTLLQRELF